MDRIDSIATLADGAVIERADYQLQRVQEDINDPNTPPDAVREVTIKLQFKPSSDREDAVINILATAKLASMKPKSVQVSLNKARVQPRVSQDVIQFEKS